MKRPFRYACLTRSGSVPNLNNPPSSSTARNPGRTHLTCSRVATILAGPYSSVCQRLGVTVQPCSPKSTSKPCWLMRNRPIRCGSCGRTVRSMTSWWRLPGGCWLPAPLFDDLCQCFRPGVETSSARHPSEHDAPNTACRVTDDWRQYDQRNRQFHPQRMLKVVLNGSPNGRLMACDVQRPRGAVSRRGLCAHLLLTRSRKEIARNQRAIVNYCSYLGIWLPGPDSNQRPID